MNADIDHITIVQVTDTHLYADPDGQLLGVHTRNSLNRVLADLAQRFPQVQAILLTGDLVHDGSPAGYQALQQALGRFDMPCYFVPGNHDIPQVMNTKLKGGCMVADKSFVLGNWKCILLDTFALDQVGGRLQEADLAFLRTHLQDSKECHVLIAMHHPPVAVGCAWLDNIALLNANDFFSSTAGHSQIRVVVFGHVHQETVQSRDGFQLLGTPSTCTQFKPGQTDFALDEPVPGYRVLHLYADGSFNSEVIRVPLI